MHGASDSLLWSIAGERTERVLDSAFRSEIAFLIEYLKSTGVQSVDHSRLGAATALAEWLVDRSASSGELRWQGSDQAGGALMRDLVQLSKIATLISNNPELAIGLKSKFERLLHDAAAEKFPSLGNTVGRDTQFELFVASALKAAGQSVSFRDGAGADLELLTRVGVHKVEVKRAKSKKSLPKLARKASKQIGGSTNGGVLVTDLSQLVSPFYPCASYQVGRKSISSALFQFMLSARDQIESVTRGTDCIAWTGFLCATILSAHKSQIGTFYCFHTFNLCASTDNRYRVIAEILARIPQVDR